MIATKVYVSDCRALGMCITPGVKYFCERNNIDYKDFIKNGIEISILELLNDPLANKVIEVAKNGR